MEIVDTDLFLEMSTTAQNLYFHLGMRADDDGFVSNPRKIQKIIGSNEDDLKILIAKKFIIPFESGVIVIRHWKINNYLRKDRYVETIYKKEKSMLLEDENGMYEVGIPNDNQMETIGLHSIEENSIEENSIEENSNMSKTSFDQFAEIYNNTCTKLSKLKIKTDKRITLVNKFNKQFKTEALEKWQEICNIANGNNFLCGLNNNKDHKNWKATFDWLINVDNATKVLEGKYEDNNTDNNTQNNTDDRWARLEQKLREKGEI